MNRNFFALFIVFALIGCGTIRALNLLDTKELNKVQFEKISEISVEDKYGFKYIKTTVNEKHFSSVSATTETQTISKDEYRQIKKIIKRYE